MSKAVPEPRNALTAAVAVAAGAAVVGDCCRCGCCRGPCLDRIVVAVVDAL